MIDFLKQLEVSPYGLCVAFALLTWLIISVRLQSKMKTRRPFSPSFSSAVCLFALGVPSGLVLSRLFWCVSNYQDYLMKPETIFMVHQGGLSLWGFLLGFWLAVFIGAKKSGISPGLSLDAFAPGMLLFIGLTRLSEVFTGQGIGRIITYDFLIGPFTAVYDVHHEARFRVYRFEALYAIFLFLIVLFLFHRLDFRKRRSGGHLFTFSVAAFSMAQIVFESMRDDDYMRFGFVRVSQAISILMLLIFAFYYLSRLKKARLLRAHFLWMIPLTLASAAFVIYQEFQVDSALYTEREHLFMLIGAFFLFLPTCFSIERLNKHTKSRKRHA